MSRRIYLNDNWKFAENYDEGMKSAEYDDAAMQSVRIPHTCKELPLHYFDERAYQMVCGYRRELFADAAWEGKKILLTIGAAAHACEVFVNGQKAGEHFCGYTAFTMEIGNFLRYGEKNVIAVRLDSRESLNIPPFGFVVDYMTYGGIYRDVYLEVKEEHFLEDVFVSTEISSVETKNAKVVSEITLNMQSENLFLKQSLKNEKTGEFVALGESGAFGTKIRLSYDAGVVELWDLERPRLYELKTELLCDGALLDEKIVRFGFREAVFRTDGFYLNGKKVRIRGLNRHQSYPYVGYAMPKSMQRLDADILKKELGVNAVRTSHYPQSHDFIDRCDELGLLVFTEIPGWQHIGDAAWKNQALENVKEMVTQYRNHASVILWGVRINESGDDDGFYARTNAAAHGLDGTRQTGGVRAHKRSSLLEDVYTYNDFLHDGKAGGCDKKRDVTSDMEKPYLISEYNGHMYPAKTFDWEEHRVAHALRHANVLDAVAGEPDIAGSFGWCMFDYNTHRDFGSGDRICYHGVMDMFRNPKLAAAVYRCEQEKEIVLELSSTMDIGEHPGCNRGETYIFTNADKVRMYKNGRFLKEYTSADSAYKNLRHGPIAIDDFVGDALKAEHFTKAQEAGVKKLLNMVARYGLGGLPKSAYLTGAWLMFRYHMTMGQAVALYNKYVGDWGGASTSYRFEAVMVDRESGREEIVKTLTKEPMTDWELSVKTDHTKLVEDATYDVAAIRLEARDENGNVLPFFNDPVTFGTEGGIELIGPSVVSLQGGMGGTYVRTKPVRNGETQNAALTIRSRGKEARVAFTVESKNCYQ